MNLKNIFKKKDTERGVRELLRENLNVLPVDMFYLDDPITQLNKEERLLYLKEFADIYTNNKLFDRIKYHINKQAQKTLGNSRDGVQDIAGSMNINGMAFIMEDITRLANLHLKESTQPKEEEIDKFKIIPTM